MTIVTYALIVDIVHSRRLPDRQAAQRGVVDVFTRTRERHPPLRELWETVGDEFQAVYAELPEMLRVTALVRLLLPDGLDLRFGIGAGERGPIGGDDDGVEDGPAWWRAREAIVEARRRQMGRQPDLRTWYADAEAGAPAASAAVVNTHLLLRDHLIGRMQPRQRRIAAGMLLGRSQTEIAHDEQISQSAVSQGIARSGAAVLQAVDELLESTGATA